jgi:penicillin G amidase
MQFVLRAFARLLRWVGMSLILMLCVIGGIVWLTLPRDADALRIPGLSAPASVDFDQDGIPRIHAQTELDAAAALGYVHARDRMFQMELMRRNASGRLSEIAGPAALPLDRMMRTLGLRQHAVADLATLPTDARAMLDAYASGVNAWIAARGRFAAPEFLLLGAPERWQPVDSLLWGKTMGLWLSANWRTELTRLELSGHVPKTLIEQLWPLMRQVPRPDASLPPAFKLGAIQRPFRALPAFPDPFTLPPTASNEWAVDGRHSATGAPLLAGDPHLALGFPGIWYLARLETPGNVLAGATAPGIPFLVLGHNDHIAWTFTTTGADTQDLFVETPVGTGDYATPDGPKPFVVREERIRISGRPAEDLTVRETRHGPVISDLLGADSPVLAVAMGNLQPKDTAAAGLLALNRAATVAEAGVAAGEISSPVQNLLVADRHDIGLFMTGRIPVRRSGDGSMPVPGADGSHDWIGWVGGDQLPHIVDPPSGRLVNTNEPVAITAPGSDGPVFLGRDAYGDWRARRVRSLLAQSDRHTAADFARIQVDTTSDFARQIVPALLAVPGMEGLAAQAQALLRNWDGTMRRDAPQPLIFNAWTAEFYRSVLQQSGIAPNQGGPLLEFVSFLLSPAPAGATSVQAAADGKPWCGGDCTPVLRSSLERAVQSLATRFGPDPARWQWGTPHVAVFAHPLLRQIPVIGRLGMMEIAVPGDDSTIDRSGPNGAMEDVHGPEYRGVYDLADLDRSLFVVAPGQSGHIFSRHARDFLVRWRDGATVEIGPNASTTEATLQLTP